MDTCQHNSGIRHEAWGSFCSLCGAVMVNDPDEGWIVPKRDLTTRTGRKNHLATEWASAADNKEKQRLLAVEWMKTLDGPQFQCLVHFIRNPEDFEQAVFGR